MTTDAENMEAAAMVLFRVQPGETVTAWALSKIDARDFPGTPALAKDWVNYRFINNFNNLADAGDLPCRVALLQEIAERQAVLLDAGWEVESVNLPGFNRRLEFSGFWHRPTRLARWCRTVLVPKRAGPHRFRLATCGGVHVWVDGALAVRFEPYTRNTEQQTEIALELNSGGSEIVMLSEELAERDTNWHVELTLLCESPVEAGVPGGAGESDMAALMALATDIRPEGEHVGAGTLVLIVDQPPPIDVRVSGRVQQSMHMRDKPPLLEVEAVLKAGETRLALAALDGLPDGCHPLDLSFIAGEARVDRHIAFSLLRDVTPPARADDLAARKREAVEFAADHGEPRIGRAIAMLAAGRPVDGNFETIIDNTLADIDERRDCSDFVMVPLLWLYGAYSDMLPGEMAERIKRSVLNYRYWVDEPGNDVMWFWSENHVLCFHVSQLLAGQLFLDETFSASGRSGELQARIAEERLGKWFDSVEAHGLSEWNSAAYYPIDFIGLFALQKWATGTIRARTEKLLDGLFTMIGLHTLGGVAAGTMGRAYDKELRVGPLTELSPFATIAFGQGWLNNGVAALPMFCAGDYSPPEGAARYASPAPGKALTAHYVQGYGAAARLALYKQSSVQLSASVDGAPGGHGYQQHIMDVLFARHPFARAWINHPGEDDPWGGRRPSYWAGNGTMPRVGQYRDALMMLYDLGDAPRIDFTHVYAPGDGLDECLLSENWLILKAGQGFAVFRASAPIVAIENGPGAGREYRAYGSRIAWICLVGEAGQDAAGIASALSNCTFNFDPETMSACLKRPGRPELRLDYADGLYVDGTLHAFPNPLLEPLIEEFIPSGLT